MVEHGKDKEKLKQAMENSEMIGNKPEWSCKGEVLSQAAGKKLWEKQVETATKWQKRTHLLWNWVCESK